MKYFNFGILFLFLFCASASSSNAASAKATPTESYRILRSVAFSSLNELQIIGADVDSDKSLRWAVWSEYAAQGMMVKLALVKNTATGPVVLHALERKGAYEPTITRITDWRHGKHPVLAFTYHQGAAAEQVELIGLDTSNQPVQLDQRLGEIVGWAISPQGQTLLGIYARPESRLVPTWYRWNEKARALVETTNPPGE
jgi:hypothetical protein